MKGRYHSMKCRSANTKHRPQYPSNRPLQNVLYRTLNSLLIFYLPIMPKRMDYTTTPIAQIKAAVSEFRAAKKKPPKLLRERLRVPKRNLRVVKSIGQVPAIGVCTFCNREFKVPLTAMNRVADAQESLRLQFTEHKCKGEMESANASSGN